MEDNPYNALAETILKPPGAKTTGLQLGEITSAPSEEHPEIPLRVSVGGTVQQEEDLLKNADLDALGFAAGDQLLLLPIEEAQRYIILCKVVSV